VDRVSCFVWNLLSSRHLTVPDRDRGLNIAVKYLERWDFPDVIGCIDG